jgi:hypothetical protein
MVALEVQLKEAHRDYEALRDAADEERKLCEIQIRTLVKQITQR